MARVLPEVRVEFAFLLSAQASTHINKLLGDGTPLRSDEEYQAIAKKYAKWWQRDNERILNGICDITGLEFYQNTIDVHVAPWFYAFSYPMVIGVTFKTRDELVNALTHEIIHRLLTDNTTYKFDYDFVKLWRSMFGEDLLWNALIHIPVHAVMEQLYNEVLNRPDLVEFDIDTVRKYGDEDYIQAWEYVKKYGYKSITAKIRDYATRMAKRPS